MSVAFREMVHPYNSLDCSSLPPSLSLQEDLRDLALPSLTSRQRLLVVERINKGYPFMQPVRKTWGIQ